MKNILIIVLSITSVLSSCNPEDPIPDQDKVYISLSLDYNHTENKTTASALFTEIKPNGDAIELKDPACVKFEGDNLLFSNTTQHYQKEFINLKDGTFQYFDLENNLLTNQISMIDSVKLFALPDSHNVANDLVIQFDTAPLAEDESVEINIWSQFSTGDITLYSDSIPSMLVAIQAVDLQQLSTGFVILKFSRVKAVPYLTESNSVGGEVLIKFAVQDTVKLY